MLELKVEIEGLHKVLGDLRKIPAAVRKGMYQGANEAAEFVAAELKSFISGGGGGTWADHADTTVKRWGPHPLLQLSGELLDSIEVVPNGLAPSVVVNAPYVVFHEMGTVHMPARPSLGQVAVQTKPRCVEIVRQAVLANINGLGFSAATRGHIKSLLTLASQGKLAFGRSAPKPLIHGKVLGMREKFAIEHAYPGSITGKYHKRVWPDRIRWLYD